MDCCTPSTERPATNAACQVAPRGEQEMRCPSCEGKGRAVGHITLKALLTSDALKRLGSTPYRFCLTTGCDVVYFSTESVFRTRDLSVPVWQKATDPSAYVCYCFEYSAQSVRDEITRTGQSTTATVIKHFVQAGKCACEVRNPQGTCCLGNVTRLVETIRLGAGVETDDAGQ